MKCTPVIRRVSTLLFSTIFCLFAVFPANAQAPGCPEGDHLVLAKALGALDLAQMLAQETASCDALSFADGGIGFRLDETTMPVYGGIRSEIAVDFPFDEGDRVKYSWDMKFPPGFVGDGPLNRWWLVAQWHDQPDRRLGEKWLGFPGRSPPIAVHVEEQGGVIGIRLILFGQQKQAWAAIPRGEWLRVSTAIRWSTGGDGEIVFAVAGHPEFDVRIQGRNMNNTFQHYLKFGQYRHPKIQRDTEVFFRNLRIEKVVLLTEPKD